MTQGYVTVRDMAQRWDLSVRQVQKFCTAEMIPGAIRFGSIWAIPDDAIKPTRTARVKPGPKRQPENQAESTTE